MHFLIGVFIFTVVAITGYFFLSAFTSLAETAIVILALVLAFLAEYTYMKIRADG
ncbi:hypothetical protein HUG15_16325 [Salicibibacter cibarius]|uniref:Uncharacterized protein n=1 Tax=Salicibibacter cibarius TaxID=2743000 RepID=A0A7T7CCJ8_9BACI|nr:hypothetical protein [Salicibibacter cibarius]QQK76984.1 hypothetical protein HUG15_16325 [Salicibibacter cibarius]